MCSIQLRQDGLVSSRIHTPHIQPMIKITRCWNSSSAEAADASAKRSASRGVKAASVTRPDRFEAVHTSSLPLCRRYMTPTFVETSSEPNDGSSSVLLLDRPHITTMSQNVSVIVQRSKLHSQIL